MSDTTPALDEAYERITAASFELPNGFVNHGAMACEALAMLDCAGDIDSWARRFAQAGGVRVEPVASAGFEWRQALGVYDRLPEWIGYFARAIDDDGWPGVVQTWVPRLMPALRTALFHGAIRTAHAVRAIDAVDTPPRRGELARALGYWAARYRAGLPAWPGGPADFSRAAAVRAAADGARRYLARPSILYLHGVTGAAVEILVGHIPATSATAALAQVHAEHAVLYAGVEPADEPHPASPPQGELAEAAMRSLDPHQVTSKPADGARGHRRSGLCGCSGNGQRPALTEVRATRTGGSARRATVIGRLPASAPASSCSAWSCSARSCWIASISAVTADAAACRFLAGQSAVRRPSRAARSASKLLTTAWPSGLSWST
jgi:hypothetical protein